METPESLDRQRELSVALLETGSVDPDALASEFTWQIGRYEVISPLGKGATSEVYLAQDPMIGRKVAIKTLLPAVRMTEDRFQREMQVLASLKHPNVVEIYDAGLHDGRPFFVMEYAGETSMWDLDLSLRESVEVLEKVALACHAAHQRGVVHRDLKPANIIMGERPVVADFGMAKLILGDSPTLTKKGQTLGTPAYMAPEQVGGGGEIGPWTDVYALGAILYEVLSGELLFTANSMVELLIKITQAEPRPLREHDPTIDPALERIALQAVRKAPEDRYASAEEMAHDLRRWLEGPRRGTPSIPLLAGLAVPLLIGAVWWSSSSSTPAPPPEPDLVAKTAARTAPKTHPKTIEKTRSAPGRRPDTVAARIEAELRRIAAWERSPCKPDQVSFTDLELAHTNLSQILRRSGLAAKDAQAAHFGRARVGYHLGRVESALADLKQTSRGSQQIAEAGLLRIRVLAQEHALSPALGYGASRQAAIRQLLDPAAKHARLSAGPGTPEVDLLLALAGGDVSRATTAFARLEGDAASQPERRILAARLSLLEDQPAEALAQLARAEQVQGTALPAALLKPLILIQQMVGEQVPLRRVELGWQILRTSWQALRLCPPHPRAALIFSRVLRQTILATLVLGRPSAQTRTQQILRDAKRLLSAQSERHPKAHQLAVAAATAWLSDRVLVAPTPANHRQTLRHLERATQHSDVSAAAWLTSCAFHLAAARGAAARKSLAEATSSLDRARALDPGHRDLARYQGTIRILSRKRQ